MTPRGRTRRTFWQPWLYRYITGFLSKCQFGLYVAFCVLLYTLVFRETLPGGIAIALLLVVLLHGIPLGQSRGKAAALILRGILEAVLNNLAGS